MNTQNLRNSPKIKALRAFGATYWLPLSAGLALLIAALDVEREAYNLPIGHSLSQLIYGGFLALSLGLLCLQPSRAPKKPLRVQSSAWWWVDVIACTYLIVPFMQWLIPAPRPENSPIQGLNGFPSSHEVSTWALSWLVFKTHPRLAPLWFGITILIGWARMETEAHYPYQVLSGAVLGVGLGLLQTCCHRGVLLPRCLALFGWRAANATQPQASLRSTLQAVQRTFKREFKTLQLVLRDERTPRLPKMLLSLAIGYALMPFDLIPDFIPIIGHLDDAIIIPALVAIALKLVPAQVVAECRAKASETSTETPTQKTG